MRILASVALLLSPHFAIAQQLCSGCPASVLTERWTSTPNVRFQHVNALPYTDLGAVALPGYPQSTLTLQQAKEQSDLLPGAVALNWSATTDPVLGVAPWAWTTAKTHFVIYKDARGKLIYDLSQTDGAYSSTGSFIDDGGAGLIVQGPPLAMTTRLSHSTQLQFMGKLPLGYAKAFSGVLLDYKVNWQAYATVALNFFPPGASARAFGLLLHLPLANTTNIHDSRMYWGSGSETNFQWEGDLQGNFSPIPCNTALYGNCATERGLMDLTSPMTQHIYDLQQHVCAAIAAGPYVQQVLPGVTPILKDIPSFAQAAGVSLAALKDLSNWQLWGPTMNIEVVNTDSTKVAFGTATVTYRFSDLDILQWSRSQSPYAPNGICP